MDIEEFLREKRQTNSRKARRRYIERHPDRHRESSRSYYQRNREKVLAKAKARYQSKKYIEKGGDYYVESQINC